MRRRDTTFSRWPPKASSSTVSSGSTRLGRAEPWAILASSTTEKGARTPATRSWVRWYPPTGSTEVWKTVPSTKTAMLVVPPPISASTTPCCFSSSSSTASAAASGARISVSIWTPAPSTHWLRFWVAASAPVTIWVSMSSRCPNMPMGSLTWSWPSTTKKRGMTCSTSRLVGMLMARAPSMARLTSSLPMGRCLPGMVATPRLFMETMWPPPMLTWADTMRLPLERSAFSTEAMMASVASWMPSTIPFLTPCDGVTPTPRMRSSSSGVNSATRVQTLVLPTSMAAKTLSLFTFSASFQRKEGRSLNRRSRTWPRMVSLPNRSSSACHTASLYWKF